MVQFLMGFMGGALALLRSGPELRYILLQISSIKNNAYTPVSTLMSEVH
jgi:hypothetical protein